MSEINIDLEEDLNKKITESLIVSNPQQYDQPTFDIQRIEDSINSGFVSIPTGAREEEIRKFLLS